MAEEYLTIKELSFRLKIKPKTIHNKVASGIFRKGVHYFSPKGLRPRFKWSAIVTWLEEKINRRPSNQLTRSPCRAATYLENVSERNLQWVLDNS